MRRVAETVRAVRDHRTEGGRDAQSCSVVEHPTTSGDTIVLALRRRRSVLAALDVGLVVAAVLTIAGPTGPSGGTACARQAQSAALRHADGDLLGADEEADHDGCLPGAQADPEGSTDAPAPAEDLESQDASVDEHSPGGAQVAAPPTSSPEETTSSALQPTHVVTQPQDQHVTEGQPVDVRVGYHPSGPGRRLTQTSADDGETWDEVDSATFSGPAAPGTSLVARWRPVATAAYDDLLVRVVIAVDGEEALASEAARIAVDPLLPVVAEHPQPVVVFEGGRVEVRTAHTGTTFPTTVRWQRWADGGHGWDDLPGENTSTLVLAPATTYMTGWRLRAVHTNAAGSTVTDAATVTVHEVAPRASVTVVPWVRLVHRLG